jgi:hypothetical protein
MATYVLQRKASFSRDIQGMLKENFECGVSILTNHQSKSSDGVFNYFGMYSLFDAASQNSAPLIERGTSRSSQKEKNTSLTAY